MTTTNTKSRLPEQEPDRRTTLVLCDGEMFISVGARKEDCWESISKAPMSWIKLCDFAASCDRATLVDLADLPTGLTEVQKGAIRSAVEYSSEGDFDPLMSAFPEVFSDDLEIAKWESGDPEEVRDELLRVAEMDGAHVTATRNGSTRSGNVHYVERFVRIHLGDIPNEEVIDIRLGGWTIAVTAPKPVDPTGGDPVVLAVDASAKKRVLFRAEDGNWSNVRGATAGVWSADSLTEIERLSAQNIAELLGGEQA